MSTILKLRRGTTAQHSTFTGVAGEATIDTTKNTVVVHDGATAGGIPLAKESAIVSAVTSLGFTPYNATNPSAFISAAGVPAAVTSGAVTTALGFTPYNATNPSGFITSAGNAATATLAANATLAAGLSANLPVSKLNSGTGATASTFWRGDGTWVAPPASTPSGLGYSGAGWYPFSRVKSTTYTNSTGYPLAIMVCFYVLPGTYFSITIGSYVVSYEMAGSTGGTCYMTSFAIVPNGATYRADPSNPSCSLQQWLEMPA